MSDKAFEAVLECLEDKKLLEEIKKDKHFGFVWSVLADKVWIMENIDFPTETPLIKLRNERITLLNKTMTLFRRKE